MSHVHSVHQSGVKNRVIVEFQKVWSNISQNYFWNSVFYDCSKQSLAEQGPALSQLPWTHRIWVSCYWPIGTLIHWVTGCARTLIWVTGFAWTLIWVTGFAWTLIWVTGFAKWIIFPSCRDTYLSHWLCWESYLSHWLCRNSYLSHWLWQDTYLSHLS